MSDACNHNNIHHQVKSCYMYILLVASNETYAKHHHNNPRLSLHEFDSAKELILT